MAAQRADVCGALGCDRTDGLEVVRGKNGRERLLCPSHAKHFLGVSS